MLATGAGLATTFAFGTSVPAVSTAAAATAHSLVPALAAQAARAQLTISTLSTKPSLVSGGEVLTRVDVPDGVPLPGVHVRLNGRDVTSAFRATGGSTLTGLVTGLRLGPNSLQAAARGVAGQLTVVDHPITGPIFSGPQQHPFICQTQTFTLPVTGGTLGPPLDSNCSAATRIDYVYMSTDGTFKPLPDPTVLPSDLAQTTTSTGHKVNYIVRVETGTINRAIYQIAVLDDPAADSAPTWYQHPAGWNGRLVYDFGGGCAPGYHQGNSIVTPFGGGLLNNLWLSKGYAAVTSTLNIFGDDCNGVLSAETAAMVKEHFIDEYGLPAYTIGWGQSGGAQQQYLIAEGYPGLLDGIVPIDSFPDTLTFFTPISDCHLLTRYFDGSPLPWTVAEKAAAEGWGISISAPRTPRPNSGRWFTRACAQTYRSPDVTRLTSARSRFRPR